MRRALALLALLGLATPAFAKRPVVVELFTSQGCSSCPPADALLSELATQPGILALAFHITYWNGLGWRDPFSLDAATDRQRAYQRTLGTDTIYTPQMVIDGRTDVVGSDRQAVGRAIMRANTKASVPITLARGPSGLQIGVAAGMGQARVMLVGYDSTHSTTVSRGENAGRQLSESNIVRIFADVGSWDGTALSLAVPRPAAEHAAVILQDRTGRILGAAVLPASGASG